MRNLILILFLLVSSAFCRQSDIVVSGELKGLDMDTRGKPTLILMVIDSSDYYYYYIVGSKKAELMPYIGKPIILYGTPASIRIVDTNWIRIDTVGVWGKKKMVYDTSRDISTRIKRYLDVKKYEERK
jgi:hypothetical protein